MEELFAIKYSYLIPLLPLLGACIAGFFGAKWLKGQSHWPIWLGVGASAVLSFMILFAMVGETHHAAPAHVEGAAATQAAHVQQADLPGTSITKIFYRWAELGDPSKAGTSDFLSVN